MKRNSMMRILLTVLVASVQPSFAQVKGEGAAKSGGSVPVGFGATFIDGETWYLFNLAPEVAFGNLGIGLNINVRFDSRGNVRPGEYEKTSDYFRVIRYLRWAGKGDPFYIRVGQLDYTLLGHGSIIYNYRNSASYDLRSTGLELDLNFASYGFESMYSNVAGKGILGFRGYVRPLKWTSLAKIPVINNFEVGATYASDLHENADKTYTNGSNAIATATDGGSMSAVGFDIGLPIISYAIFKSSVYADYAKILGYGSGVTTGIEARFSGLGIVKISGKYELRFLGDQFLPAYFNALYEHDRFIPMDTLFQSKAEVLRNSKAIRGYYGEVVLDILGTLRIVGGFQAPFDTKNRGILHLETDLPSIPGIVIRAAYDKNSVGKAFILDDNSILSAEVGYKPLPFMIVSTLYQRTFAEDKDPVSGRVLGYKKQDRIEPKVSFVFNF